MYMVYMGHSTMAKNKLEKAFYNYLKSIDRTLIEDSKINEFQKQVLTEYDNLCLEHPRCKPIRKEFSNRRTNNPDIVLYGTNATFLILKSK